jgi:starch-binding outer membrane protein, SusD/RagB family
VGKDNSLNGTVDINTILDERAIELCGEQQRWFDLKRTKTLVDRVKKYNAQASANIKEIHYYRPIPQAQIDAVTNFNNTAGTGFLAKYRLLIVTDILFFHNKFEINKF